MPKPSTDKASPAVAPEPQPLPIVIETVADVPRRALAERIGAAAAGAIEARDFALAAALHAVDQRLQELVMLLPPAIAPAGGDLRDDLVALRDLLI